jgi:hypothetical protein
MIAFIRLLCGQRWIRLDLFGPPAEDEVELRRQRLLNPQGAVIVEGGDPVR